MSDVRAKFVVESKSQTRYGYGVVHMNPVTSGSEENKSWSQYTPSGHIELNITNTAALDKFQPGDEFYIDFTKAEPARE